MVLFHITSKHQDETQQLVHKHCRYMNNRPKMTKDNTSKVIIDSIAITKTHNRSKVTIDNKFKIIMDSIKITKTYSRPSTSLFANLKRYYTF